MRAIWCLKQRFSQMIVTNTAPDQRFVPVTNEVTEGNSDLIVELQRGRVEAKLDALGGFASLQVRGAFVGQSLRRCGYECLFVRVRRNVSRRRW